MLCLQPLVKVVGQPDGTIRCHVCSRICVCSVLTSAEKVVFTFLVWTCMSPCTVKPSVLPCRETSTIVSSWKIRWNLPPVSMVREVCNINTYGQGQLLMAPRVLTAWQSMCWHRDISVRISVYPCSESWIILRERVSMMLSTCPGPRGFIVLPL